MPDPRTQSIFREVSRHRFLDTLRRYVQRANLFKANAQEDL